ncbi:MAG: DUF177 domain-containing protein [Candidatus Zixiibacteriota bacterium]
MKIEFRKDSEDGSQTLKLEENPETLELWAEGGSFEKPVKVDLSVSKIGAQLICRGKVKTSVRLECSRCLLLYDQPLVSNLDFVVDFGESPQEFKSEEDNYFVADPSSGFFEVDNLIRETILLALPLKPLCSEDCKGLCPICGTDLNKSQCSCVKKEIDPRWEKLKGLLDNKS